MKTVFRTQNVHINSDELAQIFITINLVSCDHVKLWFLRIINASWKSLEVNKIKKKDSILWTASTYLTSVPCVNRILKSAYWELHAHGNYVCYFTLIQLHQNLINVVKPHTVLSIENLWALLGKNILHIGYPHSARNLFNCGYFG